MDTVCEAWHQPGYCHRGESAPPSEPNYRAGGGREMPVPEKEQGFPFHLGILTHAERLTTYTVKTSVYWLERPIACVALKQISVHWGQLFTSTFLLFPCL